MANSDVVANSDITNQRPLLFATKSTKDPKTGTQKGKILPTNKNTPNGFQYIRKILRKQGLHEDAQDIIIKSWRDSTRKQYNTYITQWLSYSKRQTNPFKPSNNVIIQFLTSLYNRGLSYTAINTARSAISTFVKITGKVDIHKDEIISRFMRGVFNQKPSLPRYNSTWDVRPVLQYLEKLDTSSLMALTCKMCMLFLLVTAQRGQTLHVVKLSDIHFNKNSVVINVSHVIKQTRPGAHIEPIKLGIYTNKNLCIVETIKQYISRTKNLRNSEYLLISTVSPYKAVSKQTFSRWIKLTMLKAGIPGQFKPHSTRAASSSCAFRKGMVLKDIMKYAGWKNAGVFAKFYNKPLFDDEKNIFQDSILGQL